MGLFSPVHALLGQFALFGSHHSLFYAASLPFTKKLQHCKMFAGVFTSLHCWRARMFSCFAVYCHCGISQRVDIALQNVCTLSSPGCLCATLHFRKCSQPSIKLTGTPRPCHVGNLIPLHQRLTSRAPPSDTGPTSPIIKPTLVQPTHIVTPCPSVAQFDVIFHTDMVVWRR